MTVQHPAQTQTGLHVSTPSPTALAPSSLSSRPGTSTSIQSRCQLITFDMIPDDILLEIFDFYVDEDVDEDMDLGKISVYGAQRRQDWIKLVHVCRRWRSVIFQSPHRLNLRLVCTHKTRARDALDIWPHFPLIICGLFRDNSPGEANIVAAPEHNDRVYKIGLDYFTYSSSPLGYITDSSAMQKPFPELTPLHLCIYVEDGWGPKLPESFLGGTAPRLRSLVLDYVPFPGLPKLLLSATHFVRLILFDIPRSGYIPPEAMAGSLSALANLESLHLWFRFPRPRPALETRRSPLPPLTRSILPRLTKILFKGASEYLEVILARIDAPRLDELHITFFNQIIFDTPQLFQFISRRPTLRAPEKGHIKFHHNAIFVNFPSQTSDYDVVFGVRILCTKSEWQLSSLEQVCTSSFPPVSTLEDLYVFEDRLERPHWQYDVEYTLWLDRLRSFVAVKNFYLSEDFKFVPRIAPALQELVGGRTTEVLPTLENIFLEGLQTLRPLQEGIEKFVAARQLTNRPVIVSRWDRTRGRKA